MAGRRDGINHTNAQILLVEDNLADIELTLDAFAGSPVAEDIFVVRDGAEALDYIFCMGAYGYRNFEHNPKVILLDLNMPKVNGLEVLRILKADGRTRHIPVVVMTSSREETDLVRSYDLGVNSYIVKPVDSKQFDESVRTLGLYWLSINLTRPSL